MNAQEPFDPLMQFAAIERLVSKIYYRFSHLFLLHAILRDFWWGMAREEEQHACILNACRAIIVNYEQETLDPMISADKARELYERLAAFLNRGTRTLSVEEAFKIALEIETSELDVIYGKLLQLGGPQIGKTMENLGVPASVQRQRLKATLRQFCSDPQLLQAADQL